MGELARFLEMLRNAHSYGLDLHGGPSGHRVSGCVFPHRDSRPVWIKADGRPTPEAAVADAMLQLAAGLADQPKP